MNCSHACGAAIAGAVLLVGVMSEGAVAQSKFKFVTGDDLSKWCSEGINEAGASFCQGYVEGIADVLGAGNTINGYSACFQPGMTVGQVMDIVKQHLAMHPQDRQAAGDGFVARALSEAFPCR
jgi:hypothetical protein